MARGFYHGVSVEYEALNPMSPYPTTLIKLLCGDIIGVIYDKGAPYERTFNVGDAVSVKDDGYGYICPGITKSGIGIISGIIYKDREIKYHVVIGNEDGYCKAKRLTVIQ